VAISLVDKKKSTKDNLSTLDADAYSKLFFPSFKYLLSDRFRLWGCFWTNTHTTVGASL